MVPPKKHLLRHQPANAQIGLMEGNTFCTTLQPRLFTMDLNVVEHKVFYTEVWRVRAWLLMAASLCLRSGIAEIASCSLAWRLEHMCCSWDPRRRVTQSSQHTVALLWISVCRLHSKFLLNGFYVHISCICVCVPHGSSQLCVTPFRGYNSVLVSLDTGMHGGTHACIQANTHIHRKVKINL